MTSTIHSLQHILSCLKKIDFLVRTHAWRLYRMRQQDETKLVPGIYLSENEIKTLLSQVPAIIGDTATHVSEQETQLLQQTLSELTSEIEQLESIAKQHHTLLRLLDLTNKFKLSGFELDILLVALAPEVDLSYQRLYGYLQNDIAKVYPSIDLILDLLTSTFKQDIFAKFQQRSHFIGSAPLLKHGLIKIYSDKTQAQPLLSQYVQVEPCVVNYLLGHDDLSHELNLYVSRSNPSSISHQQIIDNLFKKRLMTKVKDNFLQPQSTIIYLQGAYGAGKQTLAKDISQHCDLTLLIVTVKTLLSCSIKEYQEKIQLLLLEASLQNAALYWQDFSLLLLTEQQEKLDYLLNILQDKIHLHFFASETRWHFVNALQNFDFIHVVLKIPDFDARKTIWQDCFADKTAVTNDVNVNELANKFQFTAGQIKSVWHTAKQLSYWHSAKEQSVNMTDLYQACRSHSNQALAKLAQKIVPHYCWDDIILPAGNKMLLQQILNHVKYRAQVYETWGFSNRLALGKGLHVLFTGLPGTGKTMAADVLAHELQLDLYKIDLSAIVSKYIGETEKNLNQIFSEATTSNAILFFDEADALFGKRGEVSDARDRYANIEVSYLLQKFDEYPGIVILASNLRKNIDDAFIRRIHFCIDFPLPDITERQLIWETVWPKSTPLSKDLNFELLAHRFEVSGGSIRNIALTAAFIAAEMFNKSRKRPEITMQHLLQAVQQEYQKMGRLISMEAFQI